MGVITDVKKLVLMFLITHQGNVTCVAIKEIRNVVARLAKNF